MTAQVCVMREYALDLAAAREVAASTEATRDQISMAAELLAASPFSTDRGVASELRAALFALPGAELRDDAARVRDQIAEAERKDMLVWRAIAATGIAVAAYVLWGIWRSAGLYLSGAL